MAGQSGPIANALHSEDSLHLHEGHLWVESGTDGGAFMAKKVQRGVESSRVRANMASTQEAELSRPQPSFPEADSTRLRVRSFNFVLETQNNVVRHFPTL